MDELKKWLKNSPDIEIDFDHSDSRLAVLDATQPVPKTDRSIVNTNRPEPGDKKGNKFLIPPEFAMHDGATGTLTEISALYFVRDVMAGNYVKYEPFRFYLPSGGYKPDIYTFLDGNHTLFEVKPAGWVGVQKNVNASKKSVRELPYYWGWMFRLGYLVKNKKADIESGKPEYELTWIGE